LLQGKETIIEKIVPCDVQLAVDVGVLRVEAVKMPKLWPIPTVQAIQVIIISTIGNFGMRCKHYNAHEKNANDN
jgi:hypothetical protein